VAALALLALADRLIAAGPAPRLPAVTPPAWATDISTSLGPGNVAVAGATYLVARPLLTVPYRRLVVGVITLTTMHVLLVGSQLPRDLLAAIAASAVLLALGRPLRPLDPDQVVAALRRTSIDVAEVHPASVDARGSRLFFGTTADGGGVFVKVLGRESAAATCCSASTAGCASAAWATRRSRRP
jgi:glycosyltransferase 2 family protein